MNIAIKRGARAAVAAALLLALSPAVARAEGTASTGAAVAEAQQGQAVVVEGASGVAPVAEPGAPVAGEASASQEAAATTAPAGEAQGGAETPSAGVAKDPAADENAGVAAGARAGGQDSATATSGQAAGAGASAGAAAAPERVAAAAKGAAEAADEEAEAAAENVYRVYNPYTGQHHHTLSLEEAEADVRAGWIWEGAGWTEPTSGEGRGKAVYRAYNPYNGDHHYTTDASELQAIVKVGWRDEGTAWYEPREGGIGVFRLYNPYASVGYHHYTTSAQERDALIRVGWRSEGTGWLALSADAIPAEHGRWIEGASGLQWVQADQAAATGRYVSASETAQDTSRKAVAVYADSTGRVVRGSATVGGRTVVADKKTGELPPNTTGWWESSAPTGTSQKYYLVADSSNVPSVKTGLFSQDGHLYKASSVGVVQSSLTGTGNSKLDSIIEKIILNHTGTGSDAGRRAYDYVRKNFAYRHGNVWPAGDWSTWSQDYAVEMYNVGSGNCYRYASLVCWTLRTLGYNAKVRIGSLSGGAHGWVEVTQANGKVRVVDCSMGSAHAYAEYNWYMVTYHNAKVKYRDANGTPIKNYME